MTRLLTAVAGWRGYALMAAVMLAIGFTSGWTVRDWKASADAAQARIHAAEVKTAAIADALARERAQAKVSAESDAKATAAQVQIRTITQTQIKEVPVYVPVQADARYVLPDGLVRLHDLAALGLPVPETAGDVDAAAGFLEPSRTPPSRLATTIVENYGVCHADAARLSGLQDWVLKQAALARVQ
jgi:hypothetical protein